MNEWYGKHEPDMSERERKWYGREQGLRGSYRQGFWWSGVLIGARILLQCCVVESGFLFIRLCLALSGGLGQ